MKRTKVKIQLMSAGSASDSAIMLSEALVKRWKIPANQFIHFHYGSAKQDVRVIPVSTPNTLRVSRGLASTWNLMNGSRLCIHYKTGSRTMYIGPLIGVMVSRVYPGSSDKPFGASTAFCKEMHDACAAHGASVFFFTPNDAKGQGETVRGWHYAGRWTTGTFPIPDIIYNRLTSRKYENLNHVQLFVHNAKTRHQSAMFNEKYLNKNEVFDALRKESSLQSYLPESHLLRGYSMLKAMCGKYQTVFLKPVTGSLGKGIIRIRKQPDGTFLCHFTNLGGARKQVYPSLRQLYSAISGKVKSRRYQIQQGLALINVAGRPVDFRALVQRGETGQWGITSIVARIAGDHHFVSNLARGGTLGTVKQTLSRTGLNATASHVKLRRAALGIAKGIETQISGHFAELGIDLALDTNGKVWLIEVNSKPSKDDNTSLYADRKIRPSVKSVVKYARYLTKF